ncbi:C4-dicarboxylate ABC transporter permease [Tissierella sp. P1]|jgi:C4-dicarboxylate transporter DctM subunit|uniref:TRAP transporter large permease n=1 Tax=Tissierella TaxID=41273 RepID=UPI000B9FBD23|nr:TRAP transporter large permease [Tissierella sp. P1]OZV13913.1 C4-dicarboxylate ABC transporter permease [Tissierella sp. P1]
MIIVLFLLLALFVTISIPIGIALGLATLLTLIFMTNIEPIMIAQNAFAALDSFTLMAIPFFMLAGNFMRYGGVSKRLLNLADHIIGYVTGGLGMVTTLTCMFFAAISGSGPATVSAVGSFMMPAMKEKGYDEGYAAALTAAAGTIGVIIPPSIPFVIYGVVTGTSIGSLFLAGIIPGIIMGLALMIVNYRTSKKNGYTGSGERPTIKSVLKATKDAFWALLSPVIILGGIYSGYFTPTEAAAISCVYTWFIGTFVYKEIGKQELFDCLKDTVVIAGATSFMIGLSMSFAFLLTMEQVPGTIAKALLDFSNNKIVILLLINIFLLVVGCFIDNISSCTILAPIFLPVVVALGINPIHFGIIMTMNLSIGFITPPYGANLFIASAVGKTPMDRIIKHVWPLIGAIIAVLLLTTFIPALSMIFV